MCLDLKSDPGKWVKKLDGHLTLIGANKQFVQGEQTVCSPHVFDSVAPIFYLTSYLIELQTTLLAGK